MGGEHVVVRRAELAEADGISQVHIDAWRETYSDVLPEGYFSERALERRKAWWKQQLSATPSASTIAVGLHDGVIVGFAFAGPAVGPDVEKGHPAVRDTCLYAIYVLASEYGSGLGKALLDEAIGDRPAQLWVAAGNDRAIRFYERNGFHGDGVEVVDPSLDDLRELRMVR